MPWLVEFHDEFDPEFSALDRAVRRELLAVLIRLREDGPKLGRPTVDTLAGSRLSNLKELRFNAAGGVWRVAFAFDKRRVAILLGAGDKSGRGQKRFYERLIAVAERRWRLRGGHDG